VSLSACCCACASYECVVRAGVQVVQVRDPTGPLDLMDAFYWRPFLLDALNTSDRVSEAEQDPIIFMPAALNVSDLDEVAEIVDGTLARIEEKSFCNFMPISCTPRHCAVELLASLQ
jgi:xanthine dehydrogenase iron-sulfur cluster and FAD-binding subunit A